MKICRLYLLTFMAFFYKDWEYNSVYMHRQQYFHIKI